MLCEITQRFATKFGGHPASTQRGGCRALKCSVRAKNIYLVHNIHTLVYICMCVYVNLPSWFEGEGRSRNRGRHTE